MRRERKNILYLVICQNTFSVISIIFFFLNIEITYNNIFIFNRLIAVNFLAQYFLATKFYNGINKILRMNFTNYELVKLIVPFKLGF